ncbi:phage major capsid protein [Lacisediminihabitans changchengi]|uniref:Uncharacterized protein n=1 Tax=Lacisediminihabitans changchengi TaxID=2787634 RepID=A0A934W2T2_9MICO|nr:hypothetical protein [Lacisediminihabitans changchengi]MBK4348228.1 hypothetical protein [Lacisediminihabitans changchengi]
MPQYDKAVHELGNWAGSRTVKDFRPTVLYSLYWGDGDNTDPDTEYNESNLRGAGLGEHGEPLVIPEGGTFPMVSMTGGLESFYQKLRKRGLRFDWTWEAQVNDTVGFFEQIPTELLAVSVDGKIAEFFDALLSVTAVSALHADTAPDGTQIPANAQLSPEAVEQAIYERGQRKIKGNKIGEASSYNLFVPIGTKRFWDFQMARTVLRANDGGFVLDGGRYNTALGNVTLVEHDRIPAGSWFLAPAPGSTRRPVLEFLKLRGYETPELRVQNLQGSYVGAGAISPFEGSFETDSLAYRLRNIDGAVLWAELHIVHSDGTGGPIVRPTLTPAP